MDYKHKARIINEYIFVFLKTLLLLVKMFYSKKGVRRTEGMLGMVPNRYKTLGSIVSKRKKERDL